ncbi:hypothetical protein PHJA_002355800 [Phtheirospermum japonicum]|uniref:XS domain-containing protein n=1 Tax=Phtheirospermum japonicum TaxID=374723 RepID=A0A830CX19_9LAMI|nr:hypothetical protein PHJA_002355800 [Phtheirospermum japonicum]
MGWKITEQLSSEWRREVMSDVEASALKEDLIIWPPVVIVYNSTIDNKNHDERVIVSTEKLDMKLRGEAERYHNRYAESNHGRAELKLLKSDLNGEMSTHVVSDEREEDFLYGHLGIAEDLDKLDFDTKKRCVLRSKNEILSIVNAP